MARSDLLLSLVKAGTAGDRRGFRSATEAIIAEERAKRHNVLADQLTRAIQSNGSGPYGPVMTAPVNEQAARARDFIAEVVPRRKLDELILPPVVRRAVDELIEEQQRADLLRANGLEPRHRLLLVGPPGTGKTTLAEAVAEAAGIPLYVVRYEGIIGSYLGETAARLKRVFDYVRTTPCLVFFDEFDAIGKERGDLHETGEIKRVVTSLLMQMDDLPSYTVIAAATNHPELLDRASWRRFQLRLTLPMPDTRALSRYIDAFTPRFPEALGRTPAAIAAKLGNVSYAEVEQFCLDVLRRSVLAMGEKSTKTVVSEELAVWSERAVMVRTRRGGRRNGTKAAAYSPKT
ncbi:MAG TPA: ATP-binding protein [Thermoanaerobaculia bacterium]|jgi:SpoVK/Ycf46/Vps4 family AAA+-type ATPase|nr:ATP-binding protein [Thermoanaerobaculia bacterium]